jgi:hypothetical protein
LRPQQIPDQRETEIETRLTTIFSQTAEGVAGPGRGPFKGRDLRYIRFSATHEGSSKVAAQATLVAFSLLRFRPFAPKLNSSDVIIRRGGFVVVSKQSR